MKGYRKDSFGSSQGSPIIQNPGLVGLNGGRAPSKRGIDLLKDYISFELPDDKLDGLANHFENWIKDDSIIKDYEDFKMVRQDKVIVRLYRYEAPISEVLLDSNTGGALMGYKILPYCKVLQSHENGLLTPGVVVCCSEDITQLKTNPAWIEWSIGRQSKDFNEDIPEPERLGGLLARWKEFMIRRNPCVVDENDSFTFILSDVEFKAIYKN